jgi:DNA-binding response OmpR family regulator
LETDGYLVREASNGNEALREIEFHTPDLVVLDMNMPGMDGMAVLEHLKSMAAVHKPRVIVLTAYASIATAVRATHLGAADFLEKPITPTELRQTVRSILAETESDEPSPELVNVEGPYEQAVGRIRTALRLADYTRAESLLEKAAERRNQYSAEYFNLLGVLYEAQHKWRLARRFYAKAISVDQLSKPAPANLRRLHELRAHGMSPHAVKLGDESDDILYARLPDSRS